MAQSRKLGGLPGLDSAPDVYETVEPAQTSARSSRRSSAASAHKEKDTTEETSISRQQLKPRQARSQFQRSRVDATGVDFSDRADGGRSSYRVSSRRRRNNFGEGFELEAEDETLDERVERLKREIEEVKTQHEAAEKPDGSTKGPHDDAIAQLDATIRDFSLQRSRKTAVGQSEPATNGAQPSGSDIDAILKSLDADSTKLPDMSSATRALSIASDLESRISALETSLGLPSLSLQQPSAASSATVADKPIIASLTTLEHQVHILNTTNASSLKALSGQIQKLTADAEKLTYARQNAITALSSLRDRAGSSRSYSSRPLSSGSHSYSRPGSTSGPYRPQSGSNESPGGEQSMNEIAETLMRGEELEQTTKLRELHEKLPIIEDIGPLLPGTLDRLSSLRVLHEEASNAAERLNEVESRQSVLNEELKTWKQAVDELTKKLAQAEEHEDGNRAVVEKWVKELQEKVAALDK